MNKLKLIFVETHDDVSNIRILTAILPKLKELGYELFLDILPSTMSKETLVEGIKRGLEAFSLHSSLFELGPKDLQRVENGKAFLKFSDALDKQGITYKPIDPLQATEQLTQEEYLSSLPMRDSAIASEYLESDCVFGRVGLAHLKGIQEKVIAEIGLDEAAESFRFIHIYSESIAADDEFIKEVTSLPVKTLFLDVDTLSTDEVIDKIVAEIELSLDKGLSSPKN